MNDNKKYDFYLKHYAQIEEWARLKTGIRRVNQLIACLSASIIIVAGLLAYLFLVVQVGGPPLLMMFVLVIPLGAAVILLLLVMRGLLVEAVRNRSELDSVI